MLDKYKRSTPQKYLKTYKSTINIHYTIRTIQYSNYYSSKALSFTAHRVPFCLLTSDTAYSYNA